MSTLDESAAVRRLFDRFAFGPRPGELAVAVADGFPATAKILLDPAVLPVVGVPRLGWSRQVDAARWLDRMAAAPEPLAERVAWFWHGYRAAGPGSLAEQVWTRFVSPLPPDPAVLERLDIEDVLDLLRAIVAEPAFLDRTQTLVKQPVEWLVGLMRALDVRLPDAWPPVRELLAGLRAMGQVPFEPPAGGWPSDVAWLTRSAERARTEVAKAVAGWADLSLVADAPVESRVEAARLLLGVDSWTRTTQSTLARASHDPYRLVAAASCAPEYVVSL